MTEQPNTTYNPSYEEVIIHSLRKINRTQYTIVYNTYSHQMHAIILDGTQGTKDETRIVADNEEALVEMVKKYDSKSRKFKPLEVILGNSNIIGKITSRVAGEDNQIVFTHREKEENKRFNHALFKWEHRDPNNYYSERVPVPCFFLVTEKNKEIMKQIEEAEQQQRDLYKKVIELKETFECGVNWDELEGTIAKVDAKEDKQNGQ